MVVTTVVIVVMVVVTAVIGSDGVRRCDDNNIISADSDTNDHDLHDSGNGDPTNSSHDKLKPNTPSVRRTSTRIRKRKIFDATPRTEKRMDTKMMSQRKSRAVEAISSIETVWNDEKSVGCQCEADEA